MKSIAELCKQIKGIYNIDGNANTRITGISSDSRDIEPGYLFVCFAGVHTDGSKYAAQAVEKGAVAILTAKHLPLPQKAVQIMVPDVHHAVEDMVPYFYDYPGKKMRMIGVTGTNGKGRGGATSLPTSCAPQAITSASSARFTPSSTTKNCRSTIRHRTSSNCSASWPSCTTAA